MKLHKKIQFSLPFFLMLGLNLGAQANISEINAIDVMEKVDHVNRKSFTSAAVKTKLSTCKYKVKDGGMSCKGKPRVTVLEVGEKKYGEDNLDSRSIAIVLQPITDKGIGMLTYEYYDPSKDNDVWLYLSELGKVKRLVSGSEGNEDGGSFFGTEFFVDDIALKKINDFSYKLVREDSFDDRDVWVIEATPTEARAKKTHYGKLEFWVDKERFLIVKEDLYNSNGKLFKQRLNRNFIQIDGVWIARMQTMNNFTTRRVTAIQNVSVTYNKSISDEFLTKRSLTDFTFREKNLEELRAFYK
ncbi:outer membrane lipoprotein-sorting protein [Teredinibacter sp. KSP-S5-2]|uniref:outer membrane lipoprotein-sorting protein n=1 Tax=Teredinibacter sp. KSP-S5-2 TaxID=3034506 RepID=UPI002934A03D|nr:outer membrane lipoprotein-sorting protein [Teredinibacter sp. KSP-S5-2]WNO11556.1 outer membrane lipoprotein-sorting protein [Teredinibacter sp. KSP-S5-2]